MTDELDREPGSDDAEALAVARLLESLAEGREDELSRARLRRELVAAASLTRMRPARTRVRVLAAAGALAASVLLAVALVSWRRPPVDTALLDAKESAAKLAVKRIEAARAADAAPSVFAAWRSSRMESIVSGLDSSRIEDLRFAGDGSASAAPSSPASADPTPRPGGASS